MLSLHNCVLPQTTIANYRIYSAVSGFWLWGKTFGWTSSWRSLITVAKSSRENWRPFMFSSGIFCPVKWNLMKIELEFFSGRFSLNTLLAVSIRTILSLWSFNRQGTGLCSCLVHWVLPALGLFKCMSLVLIQTIKLRTIFVSFFAFPALTYQRFFFYFFYYYYVKVNRATS